ncbi:DNA damage-induced SOS-independent cell division inhibitor A [Caulobacter sp. LjRoot300]|uniref:DNA damage-induced SOS-independent cell division inhibitor A n=1 Tax=Caulobacter sp. LjRoot300 TaxID=3342321 RepID=UPI003ECFF190
MTDIAMPSLFQPQPRSVRFTRPGRPGGVVGALNYAGVLLVWVALFVVRPALAMQVFRERRADSPIRRRH